MKQHLRRLILLIVLLIAALIPTAVTEAQPGARGGNKDQQTDKGPSVIRNISQARLTAAQIKTMTSMPELRRLVTIEGTNIRPTRGNSLWLLSNHSYGLVGGSTVQPLAAQIWTKKFLDGSLYIAACYCKGWDPNKGDDGCAFDGTPSALHCHQGGGKDCSCDFVDLVIDGPTGTATFVTPR